jgi:predicted RNase H-like nuclease (RuvC/YqgF family)
MSSFQDIINEHNATMVELHKELDETRGEFSTEVQKLTSNTLVDISTLSKKTYATQKQIEKSSGELYEQTQKALLQSKQWAVTLKEFNNSVKELGDIANWSRVIESDMIFIAKALDNTCIVTHGANNNNNNNNNPK